MKSLVLCATLLISIFGILPQAYAQYSLTSNSLWGQMYHNPAFTGWTSTNRVFATTRNQWIGTDNSLSLIGSQFVGFDSFIDSYHVGLGGYVSNETLGKNITQSEAALNSSIVIPLLERVGLTVGGGVSYHLLRQNSNPLTFIDQYNPDGSINVSSNDVLSGSTFNQQQVGFSTGVLLESYSAMGDDNIQNQTGYQLGISVKTLPFIETQPTTWAVQLPFYATYTAAVRTGFKENQNHLVSISLLVQQFGKMYQYTTGLNWSYSDPDVFGIGLGIKYRGRPLKRYPEASTFQSDALIATVDFTPTKQMRIGFAYDLPVSSLRNQTAGTIEAGIWWVFDGKKYRENNNSRYGINLRRISKKSKETDCERFRTLYEKFNNRRIYYLWP